MELIHWQTVALVPCGMLVFVAMVFKIMVIFQRLKFLSTGRKNPLGKLDNMTELLDTGI